MQRYLETGQPTRPHLPSTDRLREVPGACCTALLEDAAGSVTIAEAEADDVASALCAEGAPPDIAAQANSNDTGLSIYDIVQRWL